MRYVRYLIYDGKYFLCNDYESNVGTGISKEYLIKTPATGDVHIEYKLEATKETYLSIYENPSISANGSQMTSFNANRTSLTTSNTSFFKGPTIVSDGTKLLEYATAWAIPIRAENSMVLKKDAEYLFRITSYENSNKISLQYYFHP